MSVRNIWVCLMCDNLPHVTGPNLPVWFVSQVEKSCLSVDRCPLSSQLLWFDNHSYTSYLRSPARVCYSASAHVGMACSSTPVVHTCSVMWHPPGMVILNKSYVVVTFELDKLFTVLWNSSKCCQLSSAISSVSHIFTVTSCTTTSRTGAVQVGSLLAVVTYDCHANSSLVTHVTIHTERSHAYFAIRVNNITTWRASWFYTATGLQLSLQQQKLPQQNAVRSWPRKYMFPHRL